MQPEKRYLPDGNRVGVLTAAVLLAYALTRLINTPGFTLTLQLPGFYFAYPLTLSAAMTLMATGLTATGMNWLLHGHPALEGNPIEHWLLPTLTAFIVGISLNVLPLGMLWWIGLAVSAVILVTVFIAEYVAVDIGAPMYALASAALTALSYALFLMLIVALRAAGTRLFLIAPTTFIAAGLVALRTLHLHLGNRWEFPWAIGIALACMQTAAGVHYWPISPLQFGLILLGPLYALVTLASNLSEEVPPRRAALEPSLFLAAAWIAALLVH
ncbi:MAG TPA: hypothetical protein VIN60_07680 [Anaerolineales bacterium]